MPAKRSPTKLIKKMQIPYLHDTTLPSAQAVQFIEAALKSKTGKQLTRLEKQILKAAWDNENYSTVAENLYLSIGHVKDSASQLWQQLSDAFCQKITKNNFRWIVEKLSTTATPSQQEIAEKEADENPNSKGSILIVDDLLETLRFLTDILTECGYKVRCISGGKMALRTIRNNLPDLILPNIKMPEMDGYEVCQALKADQFTSDIPIIFSSALDDSTHRVKAFKVGGVDYITKPFYAEEIVARIQNQLIIHKEKKHLRDKIDYHQQNAESLYQSRILLGNLLNSCKDGIAALEAVRDMITEEIKDFRCLVANPIFAQLLGHKRAEIIGKPIGKKLLNQLTPTLFDSLVEVAETGEPFEQEFCLKNNSLQKWYHLTAVKFGDGCSITVREITNFKVLELKRNMKPGLEEHLIIS